MQIHTKSKILLFFFNYEEESNLKISFIIVTSFLSDQLNSLGDLCALIMQANFLGNEREKQKLIWTQITP